MNTKQLKNGFFYLAAVICYLIPLSSNAQLGCRVFAKIKTSESGNFVVKKDGSVIHGNKVYSVGGMLVKEVVHIDGEKINFSDVKEYHADNFYYISHKNRLLQRIQTGKRLNIYLYEFIKQSPGSTFRQLRCEFYVEEVSTGKLTILSSLNDLEKFIATCPTALAMLNQKSKELARAIKENERYINDVVALYNNDCIPPSKKL